MKIPIREAYDIVVVGGGPAGTMAAKTASEQGFSVLLLEKDKEIGLPVRCGEMVGKRGLTLAINPDPSWISRESHSVCFVSPAGIRINVPCPETAYMLDRPRMEKDIALMAARSGADILMSACAVDLCFGKKNSGAMVTFLYSGDTLTVRAKIVIASDGVESRMAKLAGLNPAITNLNDIGICAQYRITNFDSPDGFPELHFGKHIVPDCYGWMFPKGDGTANLGLGIRASSAKNESPVQLLNKFMQLRFPKARALALTVGAVPLGLYLPHLVNNNFMAVGDAARMANCLDGGGINYAMNAAKIAASVACEAIKEGDLSAKRLSEYEKRYNAGIGKQQKRTYKLKNAVLKVKDSTIESAAETLQNRDPSKIEYIDIVKATVKNQPSLILEAAKLFS